MELSLSFKSTSDDEYRISLSKIDYRLLSDELRNILNGQIEIIEIVLDRVKGSNVTSMKMLSEISNTIKRLFLENEHIILYYYCDDLHGLDYVRDHREMSPQKYRSELFSAMFQRAVNKSNKSEINDETICIDAVGWDIYLHLIYRCKHKHYVDLIKEDIELGYGKNNP